MDKIELKVTMEPERLDALRYFLSAKEKQFRRHPLLSTERASLLKPTVPNTSSRATTSTVLLLRFRFLLMLIKQSYMNAGRISLKVPCSIWASSTFAAVREAVICC